MNTHDLIQGSAEWHAYRAEHDNASDAPAMMGCSPYKARAVLVREVATGYVPEVDAYTQKIFDEGHRIEALMRPVAEEIIGDELYPVTGSNGRPSASFDGLTMARRHGFEHKSLNDVLRVAFANIGTIAPKYRNTGDGGRELPLHYRVQMEQQLMVSDAECILFMASKWQGDECVEQHHVWYFPDAELREKIVAGWAQFARDVAAYVPGPEDKPKPVAHKPENLPALMVRVSGEVMESNLPRFKEHALAVFAAIKRDLKTDQDFEDAEATVKWCADVEQKLSATKSAALAQTASIEELFRTIDEITGASARTRIDLDKLVKSRKESLRADEVAKASVAWTEFTGLVCVGLKAWVPGLLGRPDFNAAIKGKRSMATVRDAISDALASGKANGTLLVGRVATNLAQLEALAPEMGYLFPDAELASMTTKPAEDFAALVTARVQAHQAAQALRASEQAAKEAAEAALQKARLAAPPPAPAAAPTPAAAPARPMGRAATPKPSAAPTLRLATLNDRFGFMLPASLLAELGYPGATHEGARMWHEEEFGSICDALNKHIGAVRTATHV